MTLKDKLHNTLKDIDRELHIINLIIEREERNDLCKSAMFHRGERYGINHIKEQLTKLLEA